MHPEITTVDGNYEVSNPVFSPDGTTLLLDVRQSIMAFGIPTETRPIWQPITGHIIPSGVNLRAEPRVSAEVIGYASGDVIISGRSSVSNAVYLPEFDGWIWSDSEYLDLGDYLMVDLPIIYVETDD